MKAWPLSLGLGFCMKHWYRFPLERALSRQVPKSVSWGTTCSPRPLTCQKMLSLPTLTGTTRCSPGRNFTLPWIRAHLMHQRPERKPNVFPTSFFYLLLQISQFPFPPPPSKKVSLQGRGDTCRPELLSSRGAVNLLFFSKTFPCPQLTVESS